MLERASCAGFIGTTTFAFFPLPVLEKPRPLRMIWIEGDVSEMGPPMKPTELWGEESLFGLIPGALVIYDLSAAELMFYFLISAF